MAIKFPGDHGRSMLEKLDRAFPENANKPEKLSHGENRKKIDRDTFQKSPEPAVAGSTETPIQSPNNDLNISFQFDLFYELSTRVEAKMGQSGANRFAEISGTVAETFKGSFDLKIDGVGSFLKNTDSALNISPETTNEFFNAVEGLADLEPKSLENFLTETEDFFSELEKVYGEAGGTFDQIKEQMQQQAKAFFADVGSAREDALKGMSQDVESLENSQTPEATEGESGVPAEATDPGQGLIKMVFKPEMMIPAEKYQDFLQKFIDYTEKFRQQMLQSFFNKKPAASESMNLLDKEIAKPTELSAPEVS